MARRSPARCPARRSWYVSRLRRTAGATSRRVTRELFAGVMSGTSLDGIDAVLADFAPGRDVCRVVSSTHVDFPAGVRHELFALQVSGPDEIVRAARPQRFRARR